MALVEVESPDVELTRQPVSYDAGLKDPAQRQGWLDGDVFHSSFKQHQRSYFFVCS